MANTTRIAVLIGSTREERQGDVVTNWFVSQMQQQSQFEIDVVDLRSIPLPDVQYNGHPKLGKYPPDVAAFAERIDAADGFVWVTPEYNHGYPASLKHAIDMVYKEWKAKPVAFVGYGGVVGGARSIEQLRAVCGELHLMDIRDAVTLPFVANRFEEDGSLKPDPVIDNQVQLTLQSLQWWANALRNARAAEAYPV
jgi:NAD(P)H-dependent FMN reductase